MKRGRAEGERGQLVPRQLEAWADLLVAFHHVEGGAEQVPQADTGSAGGLCRPGGVCDIPQGLSDHLFEELFLFEEFFLARKPVVEGAVRQAGLLGDAPGGRCGDALAGHHGARGADQLGAAALVGPAPRRAGLEHALTLQLPWPLDQGSWLRYVTGSWPIGL